MHINSLLRFKNAEKTLTRSFLATTSYPNGMLLDRCPVCYGRSHSDTDCGFFKGMQTACSGNTHPAQLLVAHYDEKILVL